MYVPAQTVMELLQVSRRQLLRWHQDGVLLRHGSGLGSYSDRELDVFLATHARNFAETPRLRDLLGKRVVFVQPKVAGARMDIGQSYLRYLQKLYLPHIRFPGDGAPARFSLQGVLEILVLMKESVSADLLARACGNSVRSQVVRAIKAGVLQRVPSPEHDRTTPYVSRASAQLFLRRRLPAWVEPLSWLTAAAQSDFRLVPQREAAIMLGVAEYDATRVIHARHGLYVAAEDGKNVMVWRGWIEKQLAVERPLQVSDLSRIFDVTEQTIGKWRVLGLLVCPIEDHPHPREAPYLLRSCWIAYVRMHCSPGYERAAWHFVEWRMMQEQPPRLLNLDEVARRLGRTKQMVLAWAHSGVILGVELPSRDWCFEESHVNRYAGRLRQR